MEKYNWSKSTASVCRNKVSGFIAKRFLPVLLLAGFVIYVFSQIPNYRINQNRKKLRALFIAGKYDELRRFSLELSDQAVYKDYLSEWEGRILIEEKRYQEAIPVFEELAKKYPSSYPWWIGYNRIALARAYFGAGMKDLAKKELDAAMCIKEAPQVIRDARIAAREMGFLNTTGAILPEDSPDAGSVLPELWSLYQKDRMVELERRFAELATQSQYIDGINHLRGRILVENREFAAAVPLLEPLTSGTDKADWLPGYSGLYLARAVFGSNRREEAGKALESVLRISSRPKMTIEAKNLMVRLGFSPEFKNWVNVESRNTVCHFSPAFAESERTKYVAEHEQAFADIQQAFVASLPRKLDIYVWNSREEANLMGVPMLSFARPDLCSVYVHREASIGHEMTHVICQYAPKSVARNLFLMEGTAVCFDYTGENKLEKAASGIIRQKIPVPTVEQLWRSMRTVNDRVSYPFAGGFVRRLIDTSGMSRFRELLQTGGEWEDAVQLYGPGLLSLADSFQAELAAEVARQKAGQ
jgi:tetratricopeptide (TPR) repeat protein